MSFNDVVVVYVRGSTYRIYFWYMRKDDAISIVIFLIWMIKMVFFLSYII